MRGCLALTGQESSAAFSFFYERVTLELSGKCGKKAIIPLPHHRHYYFTYCFFLFHMVGVIVLISLVRLNFQIRKSVIQYLRKNIEQIKIMKDPKGYGN